MTDHVLELTVILVPYCALIMSIGAKLFYSKADGAKLQEAVQFIKHTLDEIKAKL